MEHQKTVDEINKLLEEEQAQVIKDHRETFSS